MVKSSSTKYNSDVNQTKRKIIHDFAQRVRTTLKLKTPINLQKVVIDLGGTLKKDKLESGVSGKIEKDNEAFIITINECDPETRQSFTIAHELGHLFLHMGYIVDPEKWAKTSEYIDSVYYRVGYTEEEYEANEFAGAFLMPEEEFRILFFTKLQSDIDTVLSNLAEHYSLSTEAIKNRAKWLGLISWQDEN